MGDEIRVPVCEDLYRLGGDDSCASNIDSGCADTPLDDPANSHPPGLATTTGMAARPSSYLQRDPLHPLVFLSVMISIVADESASPSPRCSRTSSAGAPYACHAPTVLYAGACAAPSRIPKAFRSRWSASVATDARLRLSPTMLSAASGAIAATMLVLGPVSYTITLHGSRSPTSSSASNARSANGGLHAPRMTYLRKSLPSFALSVCCTSIVVNAPKPCAVSRPRESLG